MIKAATKRVAVADDERDIREFLREGLTRLGWQVTVEASGGKALVEGCRKAPPDLIITDVRMPDMDGIEAAAAATAERPVPVVLISAHHDPETLGRAADASVLGYLVKPFTEAGLKAAVTVAVSRFEQMTALKKESADLRQSLEDRKVIERAKGALMRRLGVGEDGAFRKLREAASSKNLKLSEAAKQVMAAEDVFAAMERG